jgi:hypothetical protein
MTSGVVELAVAFRDARAADLGLHLGLAPQEALAGLTVDGNGWTAELRILGASHQVLIEQGRRTVWSETVACHLPDGGHRLTPLPRRHRPGPGPDYEFRSRVVRLGRADFGRRVEGLLEHAGDALALCARFPGDELGATALRLDPDDRQGSGWVSWRTWHTYPRTGEVVTTSSRYGLGASSPAGRT